jgi:hypothetical protein
MASTSKNIGADPNFGAYAWIFLAHPAPKIVELDHQIMAHDS